MQKPTVVLDIEVYPAGDVGGWAQARYLVHGYDDVYWVNSPSDAAAIIENDLNKLYLDHESIKANPEGGKE